MKRDLRCGLQIWCRPVGFWIWWSNMAWIFGHFPMTFLFLHCCYDVFFFFLLGWQLMISSGGNRQKLFVVCLGKHDAQFVSFLACDDVISGHCALRRCPCRSQRWVSKTKSPDSWQCQERVDGADRQKEPVLAPLILEWNHVPSMFRLAATIASHFPGVCFESFRVIQGYFSEIQETENKWTRESCTTSAKRHWMLSPVLKDRPSNTSQMIFKKCLAQMHLVLSGLSALILGIWNNALTILQWAKQGHLRPVYPREHLDQNNMFYGHEHVITCACVHVHMWCVYVSMLVVHVLCEIQTTRVVHIECILSMQCMFHLACTECKVWMA